jgi:two-component system, cell cycle sensor histidine kinase and response regulator CckA
MSEDRGRPGLRDEVAEQKVLVVDDEPVLRDVLCKLLAQPRRALVGVASEEEALAAAADGSFCAALVDKNLIGASGLGLARTLRKLHPELEVILMSGHASIESALEAMKIGAFDYVTKPIEDYASLSIKLQNAVDKSLLVREQRALIRQLFDSELRFRTLFEATPDALLVVDAVSGRFEDANPAALALYGYSPGELVRMRPADLFDPAAGMTAHGKKDGSRFSAEVTSSRFELRGRSLMTLSVRDVSAREAAEKEQRALAERLRRSQKMEAIGRLAGGIAHDFGNLLAVVQAHADLIGEDMEGDHPARPDLDGIQRATARGASLTQHLLLFGRSKEVEQASVCCNAVVADVQRMLSRVLGPRVKLLAEPGPDLWSVRADGDQLGQVLLNLTLNARDALCGAGTICVRTENLVFERSLTLAVGELPAGRYVRLSVTDDGSGMTPEVMLRLFEPFFTTKPVGQGTGLGLATAYGIVRSANGGMEVKSKPGEGSTFAVYLPACEAPAAKMGARPAVSGIVP